MLLYLVYAMMLLYCLVLSNGAAINKTYDYYDEVDNELESVTEELAEFIDACAKIVFDENYPISCREAFDQYKEAASRLTDITPSLNTICNSAECYGPIINYYKCLGFQDYGKKLCMKEGDQYCHQIHVDLDYNCARDCNMINCNSTCHTCIATYFRESGCCIVKYSELDYYSGIDLTMCGITYKQCSNSSHTTSTASTDIDDGSIKECGTSVTVINVTPSTCTVAIVMIACIIYFTVVAVRICHY